MTKFFATTTLLLAGCTATLPEDGGDEPAEAVGSVTSALHGPGATEEARDFEWRQGDPPVYLQDINEGPCVLSTLAGNFQGFGEAVELYMEGSRWVLKGRSQQAGVRGTATCTKWSNFHGRKFSSVNYMVGREARRADLGKSVELALWDTHSFCSMTGISGKLSGWLTTASVTRGTPPKPWMLNVHGVTNPIWASAHCFSFPGYAPMPMLPSEGIYQDRSESNFDLYKDVTFRWLPDRDRAFCAIMQVSGPMQTPDTTVAIGAWGNRQYAFSTNATLSARIRCVRYDLDAYR